MNKVCALAASVLLLSTLLSARTQNQQLSRLALNEQASISADLGRDMPEYLAQPYGDGFRAENHAQNLQVQFRSGVVEVRHGNASWNMRMIGYGSGSLLTGVTPSVPRASSNRIEYQHGPVIEWYVNGPLGLEQGFTITKNVGIGKDKTLRIALETSRGLMPVMDGRSGISLQDSHGKTLLRYSGLSAQDANGKRLETSLEVRDHTLLLEVQAADVQYPVAIDPWVQAAELTITNEKSLDYVGISVSISGNTVVVGAQNVTVNGNSQQGAAYVYVKSANGWSNMTQTAKLTSSDGAANDRFGMAVAISGNTVVVGTSNHGNGGAAYVFVEPQNGWTNMTETAEFKGSGGLFGSAVAISGSTVVVGASSQTAGGARYAGAVYVYVEPVNGWQNNMDPTAELSASNGSANGAFGWSVATNATTVAVGAAYETVGLTLQGAVYVFVRGVEGWQTTSRFNAELTASDAQQADLLGSAVSISSSGLTIVGGNPAAVINGNSYQGAAYVFVRQSGGWASGTETAKLTASNGQTGDYLGAAVSNDDNQAILGAFNSNTGGGAAYYYLAPVAGWHDMTQTSEIKPSDEKNYDQFGTSVSLDGGTTVIGAPQHGVGGVGYVFVNGPVSEN